MPVHEIEKSLSLIVELWKEPNTTIEDMIDHLENICDQIDEKGIDN